MESPVLVLTRKREQSIVIGDNVGATLSFTSLKPVDNAEADSIADTIRVD